MNDDYHQMAAECGVPISSERVMHHLRCLSVDCEWRALEVEEYIKQLERDRDVLVAEVCAWRAWSDPAPIDSRTYCTGSWAQVESSRLDTDNNQVLDRTKEIK